MNGLGGFGSLFGVILYHHFRDHLGVGISQVLGIMTICLLPFLPPFTLSRSVLLDFNLGVSWIGE